MHIRSPKWFFIAVIFSVLALAPAASATTYYIAANGSDSNNGTSKSTPWLHAPGMPNCAATCASVTPTAGDKFIFRGGDTWHWGNSAANPYTGGNWNWSWSGASGSPIYLGVDKTWYTGSAWTRPVMTRDNPLSTSQVSACAHDDSNAGPQVTIKASYVTLDNFEFIGTCWSKAGNSSASIIHRTGSYITLENFYVHGWTHSACTSSTGCDTAHFVYTDAGSTGDLVSGAVFDGSDSPPKSGFAMFYYTCGEVKDSVFRYLSNGIVCGGWTSIHDNLFEYMYESYDNATHGNVVESLGAGAPNPLYFYNNVVRHVTLGVTLWLTPVSGGTLYFYNNILYDIGNSVDCVMFSQMSSGGANYYLFNNTLVSSCRVRYINSTGFGWPCPSGTVYFTNNHFIGYGSPGSLGSVTTTATACSSPPTQRETTDVYQSLSTASTQGYTNSTTGYCANEKTPCAPTASTNGTVGAGTNETSQSSAFGTALDSDTTLGVSYDAANHTVIFPARTPHTRPSSGAWDAGAYEYGGTTNAPQPPTNLTDVVH